LVSILNVDAALFGSNILPYMALLTGIFIFISYITKIHNYFLFIPSSVVHGFTAGVAMIIILNQIDFTFGL